MLEITLTLILITLFVLIWVVLKDRNKVKDATAPFLVYAQKMAASAEKAEKNNDVALLHIERTTATIETIKDVFIEVRQLMHEQNSKIHKMEKVLVKHEERLNDLDKKIGHPICKLDNKEVQNVG